MSAEEWRQFNERFWFSNLGNVRRITKAGVTVDVHPSIVGDGYRGVKIQDKNHYVHRIVAQLFVGKPYDDQTEVYHIDGNRTNNNAVNLAWRTSQERVLTNLPWSKKERPPRPEKPKKVKRQTHQANKDEPRARRQLSEEEIAEIEQSTERGVDLAKRYGVSDALISLTRHKKSRYHKRIQKDNQCSTMTTENSKSGSQSTTL